MDVASDRSGVYASLYIPCVSIESLECEVGEFRRMNGSMDLSSEFEKGGKFFSIRGKFNRESGIVVGSRDWAIFSRVRFLITLIAILKMKIWNNYSRSFRCCNTFPGLIRFQD